MDLAPHNLIISPTGQAKLVDFGISRATGLSTTKPQSRQFRGRTAYLAPEQLDGLTLDRRADLFALGIILHEMILCRPLFRVRSDHQTATRILHAPIPRLRRERADCPEELDLIVQRTLRRDRDERYGNAGEILRDLDCCAQAHGIVHSTTAIREEIAIYHEALRQHQERDLPRPLLEQADLLEDSQRIQVK
jgi:eukaryotic-like serine/threonine-protein kinase